MIDQQLKRLALAFTAAFLAMALASGYWGYARRETLLTRGDNPRRVLAERRVARGFIFDRNGTLLAETAGAPGELTRHYPYPDLAPVLGYVSPFYGLAGIEGALDPILHGDQGLEPLDLFWRTTVLGTPPAGRAVRLSIDLTLQAAADAALSQHTGAAVVLEASTGEILALASHPTYNANTLEDDWDNLISNPGAPLLNRVTLGLYQPGGALWPLVIGAAAEANPVALDHISARPAQPVRLNGQSVGCRVDPRLEVLTLRESLLFGCPGPIAELAQDLGADVLQAKLVDFGLYSAPPLEIATISAAAQAIEALAQAAIGQGALTITPLHLALATAAIARGGVLPPAQLVLATENPDGLWRPAIPTGRPTQALAPETAQHVKGLLRDGYGATALTGAAGETLAWFSGFTPYDETHFVVVVLLEDGDLAAAARIGTELLRVAGAQLPGRFSLTPALSRRESGKAARRLSAGLHPEPESRPAASGPGGQAVVGD